MTQSIWTDFKEIAWPVVGDRVRFQTMTARRGFLERITGEGIVTARGAGIQPHFTVGTQHIHPTLGDTWELITAEEPTL